MKYICIIAFSHIDSVTLEDAALGLLPPHPLAPVHLPDPPSDVRIQEYDDQRNKYKVCIANHVLEHQEVEGPLLVTREDEPVHDVQVRHVGSY